MQFTVVGVHSAKFDNEKDLAAIRNAVLRYNITHPVSIHLVYSDCSFYFCYICRKSILFAITIFFVILFFCIQVTFILVLESAF